VVAERDRSRRIAFEVKARNEYFDLAPIRARYRRAGGQAVTDLEHTLQIAVAAVRARLAAR